MKKNVARPTIGAATATLMAASLAGCGSMSEQSVSAFSSPGKYQIYTCNDLEERVTERRKRQVELEQLMARASQAAGGELVNSLVYRSEYLQTRGDLAELKKAGADKQCATESQFSSGRAVF